MSLHGYDGATLLDLGAVKKAGGVWVSAYVSGIFAVPDGYAQTVKKAGLGSNPNYERGVQELISGRWAGQVAGRVGIADAIRAGYPADGTIRFPFSVDMNVDPTNYHLVADAFQGIEDVNAGRFILACYGQGGLISYLRNVQKIAPGKGWLSGSSSYPGFNVSSADVCVVQSHDAVGNWLNTTVPNSDVNTITDPIGLAAYWPAGSLYGMGEAPLTPDELTRIITGVRAAIQPDLVRLAQYQAGTANAVFSPNTVTDANGNPLQPGVFTASKALPTSIEISPDQIALITSTVVKAVNAGTPSSDIAGLVADELAKRLSGK